MLPQAGRQQVVAEVRRRDAALAAELIEHLDKLRVVAAAVASVKRLSGRDGQLFAGGDGLLVRWQRSRRGGRGVFLFLQE